MVLPGAHNAGYSGYFFYCGYKAIAAIQNFRAAPSVWGFATAAAALVYLINFTLDPAAVAALAATFNMTYNALMTAIAGLRAYFGV
jgi:hypothetical protein